MSNNKSFFQKLSDSLTSLFPFNSSTKEIPSLSHVPFEKHLPSIRFPVNRRVASVAFGEDCDIDKDETKIKRAKLHHDPMSFPTSRIIKPQVPNVTAPSKLLSLNNFNDAASDLSDASNISVSTSGVSSLHPKSNKRINLMDNRSPDDLVGSIKYPRNLNLSYSQVRSQDLPLIISDAKNIKNKFSNNFISSPARKILEKLDRLSTPLTAADRLTCTIMKEKHWLANNNGPYSRRLNTHPPIIGRKPNPVKAVTVTASSVDESSCGPIRRKQTINEKKTKLPLGCNNIDSIDLDIEHVPGLCGSSIKLNFSNMPLLKKSQSTSTDDLPKLESSKNKRESSPILEFTFRPPNSVDDESYRISTTECNINKPVSYEFKSKIPLDEIKKHEMKFPERFGGDSSVLWRCDTCFLENLHETLECTNCGNLSKKHCNKKVLSESCPFNILGDKVGEVSNVLESKKLSEKPLESNPSNSVFAFGAPTSMSTNTIPNFSFGSNITKESTHVTSSATSIHSANIVTKSITSEPVTTKTTPVFSFGNNLASVSTDSTPTISTSSFSFGNNLVKVTDSITSKSLTGPTFSFGSNLTSSSETLTSSNASTIGILFSATSDSKESLFSSANWNSVYNSTGESKSSLLFGTSVSSSLSTITASTVSSTASSAPFVFTPRPNTDTSKSVDAIDNKIQSSAPLISIPEQSTIISAAPSSVFMFGQTSTSKENQMASQVTKEQINTKLNFGPATTSTGEPETKSSFVFGSNPNSELNKHSNSSFSFNSANKTSDISAPKTLLFVGNSGSAPTGQNLFGVNNSTQFYSKSSPSVSSTSSGTFTFGSAQPPSMVFGQVSNPTLSTTIVTKPSFNFNTNLPLEKAAMSNSIKSFDFGSTNNIFPTPLSNKHSTTNASANQVFQFNSVSNSDIKSSTFGNSSMQPRRTLKPRKKRS